jgi:hypothetical protein
MRNLLLAGMAVIACLVLTGCPVVGSKEIMGYKPQVATPEIWNGHWVTDKSIIEVKVAEADKGVLTVYFIDNGKKKGPYKVFLRDVNGKIVASLKDKSKDFYFWTAVKVEKDFGYFMLLDMDKFRELIKSGKMPGEIIKDVPVFGKLSAKQMDDLVNKAANDPSFHIPITYVRLEGLDRIAKEAREAIKNAKSVKE